MNNHPEKLRKLTFRALALRHDIRSDEGLTLETSAFLIFHSGYSTFINSFDKTKFLSISDVILIMLQILRFVLENLKVLAFLNNLEIYTEDKRKIMILRPAKISRQFT